MIKVSDKIKTSEQRRLDGAQALIRGFGWPADERPPRPVVQGGDRIVQPFIPFGPMAVPAAPAAAPAAPVAPAQQEYVQLPQQPVQIVPPHFVVHQQRPIPRRYFDFDPHYPQHVNPFLGHGPPVGVVPPQHGQAPELPWQPQQPLQPLRGPRLQQVIFPPHIFAQQNLNFPPQQQPPSD